jgi:hypothetical protein
MDRRATQTTHRASTRSRSQAADLDTETTKVYPQSRPRSDNNRKFLAVGKNTGKLAGRRPRRHLPVLESGEPQLHGLRRLREILTKQRCNRGDFENGADYFARM